MNTLEDYQSRSRMVSHIMNSVSFNIQSFLKIYCLLFRVGPIFISREPTLLVQLLLLIYENSILKPI